MWTEIRARRPSVVLSAPTPRLGEDATWHPPVTGQRSPDLPYLPAEVCAGSHPNGCATSSRDLDGIWHRREERMERCLTVSQGRVFSDVSRPRSSPDKLSSFLSIIQVHSSHGCSPSQIDPSPIFYLHIPLLSLIKSFKKRFFFSVSVFSFDNIF